MSIIWGLLGFMLFIAYVTQPEASLPLGKDATIILSLAFGMFSAALHVLEKIEQHLFTIALNSKKDK